MSTLKWSVVFIWDLILKDIWKKCAYNTIFSLVPMIQALNMPFWHPYLEIWLIKLSDYSKPEKKLLTTNLLTPYFIQCWKHSTKCVININISPRYYNLIKLCFMLAKDQICWSNVQTMLIAIVTLKRKAFQKNPQIFFQWSQKEMKVLKMSPN